MKPPASVLGFRNNRTRDLCELDLRSMDTCLDELARLRAAGRSRDPLAVTMARNCQARPVPSDAVRSRALAAWRDWFHTIATEVRVTVVLMPEHSLFHRGSDADPDTDPDPDPGVALLETLAAEGAIELLDLSATLAEAPNPECAYYSDLVHANVDGMERLTSRLIDHLQGASEP